MLFLSSFAFAEEAEVIPIDDFDKSIDQSDYSEHSSMMRVLNENKRSLEVIKSSFVSLKASEWSSSLFLIGGVLLSTLVSVAVFFFMAKRVLKAYVEEVNRVTVEYKKVVDEAKSLNVVKTDEGVMNG